MADWYSPGEIRFQRDEMIFLIEHLDMLSKGEWPPDPDLKGSGYVDAPLNKGKVKPEGHFVRPVQFAAEVKMRLKKTGAERQYSIRLHLPINAVFHRALFAPLGTAENQSSGYLPVSQE